MLHVIQDSRSASHNYKHTKLKITIVTITVHLYNSYIKHFNKVINNNACNFLVFKLATMVALCFDDVSQRHL